jgi:putative zinc finger/helix-turn-helix YgiT family protein
MSADRSSAPKCPECASGRLVPFIRDEEFDHDLGDEIIKVRAKGVPVERCNVCGMIASGPDAARVRHEAICAAAGFLTPSEIKTLREQFGWSQKDLADLTGLGMATISRYERGRLLQNRSTNKILQAIRDCPEFRAFLEADAGRKKAGPLVTFRG